MAETNNILIVQAWIKSTIFSVQIWSHFFIFYRITLNPTAFTERVYCLSVKASPSPENYSRAPRDYSVTTKGVSLFKTQTESCPAPPRSYAGLWRTGALLSRRPAVSGVGRVTAPRASRQVPSFGRQGYTAALLVHSQIFSICFLKLWLSGWAWGPFCLRQLLFAVAHLTPPCLLLCNSAYTVYIFLKDIKLPFL